MVWTGQQYVKNEHGNLYSALQGVLALHGIRNIYSNVTSGTLFQE